MLAFCLWIQTRKRFKRTVYWDKTQPANCRGNPLSLVVILVSDSFLFQIRTECSSGFDFRSSVSPSIQVLSGPAVSAPVCWTDSPSSIRSPLLLSLPALSLSLLCSLSLSPPPRVSLSSLSQSLLNTILKNIPC